MCTGCGRQIPVEYNVCPHCGRPQTLPQFNPRSSSIENDKIIGIIGTLLLIVGPLVSGSWSIIPVLIGTVLLLVSFNGLAKHYQDRSIFQNVLYGGIIFVVGLVIAMVIMLLAAASLISLGALVDPAVLQTMDLAALLLTIVLALVIILASSIVGSIFIRKSLKVVAQKSGTTMFATAGTVLFIGAILTIILIGLLIIWIAMILLLVAFLQLKNEPAHEWRPSM